MENGVGPSGKHGAGHSRVVARDAQGAVLATEAAVSQLLDVGQGDLPLPQATNAFGQPLALAPHADAVTRLESVVARASAGERVGFLSTSADLVRASAVMQGIAKKRLGVVVHAFESEGAEAALGLAGLGWGVLFASDVEESIDLTLVARRAAEDSGTPFVVVHDLTHVRRVEPLPPLDPAFVDAFVGPAATRTRRISDPAHPTHAQVGARAFAERVPFALGSALRELESLTGRRRDVVTRSPPGAGADASLMLVGIGALGDVLLGEVPRLRAEGHDVGAVKVTAFRPFPGPRLVRLLARSLAITVVEHRDAPLAQSSPLAREIKAGFSDALTWAPEYPGIGRIPRIHGGIARSSAHDVEAHDLDAVVANMLAGELGRRFFVLGGDPALDLPPAASQAPRSTVERSVFHIRGIAPDAIVAATAAELASSVIASLLSLRVRALIRPLPSGGSAFDLAVGSERPVGVHLSSALDLVVLADTTSLIRENPIARLSVGGTIAVPSQRGSAEAVWGDMPPYVKAVVFDREARLVAWQPPAPTTDDDSRWASAAAFTGVVLGVLAQADEGRPHVDPSLVERDVEAAVRLLTTAESKAPDEAARVARSAFEASIAVPRSLVEQDQDGIRLGRQDARAATP